TELTYVLNTKTKKFHNPSCSFLPTANRKDTSESRESVIAQGYEPCKKCNP
ncbi:MAG: MBL fold metallo-hydrolase, partial [Lachnospiraceae bacterium]|nr:MBL fold metallo-hydrolase [Lachnospiraceae bacterium]